MICLFCTASTSISHAFVKAIFQFTSMTMMTCQPPSFITSAWKSCKKWLNKVSSEDETLEETWSSVTQCTMVHTMASCIMLTFSILCDEFYLGWFYVLSLIMLIPGWCFMLFPFGQERMWYCRCYLWTTGFWIIFISSTILYVLSTWHWGIGNNDDLCISSLLYGVCIIATSSCTFIQIWGFIHRQTHEISTYEPLLSVSVQDDPPLLS